MEEQFDLDQYEATPDVTAEFVLDQVDDLLIYRHYLGEFKLGRPMKSPFRRDSVPSFSITLNQHWLKLMWKDFGTGDVGDCFKLVAKLKGIGYREAVEKVACDFGIFPGCKSVVSKKQMEEARAFKENFQKREYLIQVERRSMNKEELAYWEQYAIGKQDLLDNDIYAIDKLWINKRLLKLDDSLHFAYYFPDWDKWKIYSPESPDFKWFGNISSFTMEGSLSHSKAVTPTRPVIVTKSRKDRIILSKLYPYVLSCQNEAETAIPKSVDEILDSLFPAKYCWFDSDEPGKAANRKLNYRGYKWINVPNKLYEELGLKDPGDVIKHLGWYEGSKILIKELEKKGLV